MNKLKEISRERYREILGLSYEDFKVGMIIEHRPGRTITESDNIWLTLLSHNQHPLHIDNNYAKMTDFNKTLLNSSVTFLIVNGMTVSTLSARAVCNLGWDKVCLPHPVYVGDTLYAESKVIFKRESSSNPDAGIVKVYTCGFNQDDVKVIDFERTFMVYCEGAEINY